MDHDNAVLNATTRLRALPVADIDLPKIQAGHPILAWFVTLLMGVALVPAFVFVAPSSIWTPQPLLVVLLVASYLAFMVPIQLQRSTTFDTTMATTLVAIAMLGPLAAAVPAMACDFIPWLTGEKRLIGGLGTLVALCWGSIIGALVFVSLSPDHGEGSGLSLGAAIVVVGVVLYAISYLICSWLVGTLHDGVSMRTMVNQEVRPVLLPIAIILAVAAGTAMLYAAVGYPGLAPLLALAVAPKLWFKARQGARRNSRHPVLDCSMAIADVLRLDGRQKKLLAAASRQSVRQPSLGRIEDFGAMMNVLFYAKEAWDGQDGFPGIVHGDEIPIESRVLAVANRWAELTREVNPLAPGETLVDLRAKAGTELDPTVVAAAHTAVEQELLPVR